jgi:hypothetical protein
MTTPNPITPPPELVQQWCEQLFGCPDEPEISAYELVRLAAQYGADQELEACCELLTKDWGSGHGERLRRFRRPKPPSLNEQALAALGPEPLPETGPTGDTILNKGSIERHRTIRRALEALND